jgi:hypothetical protein
MPRLIRVDAILENWHPLAGTPAPEHVPTHWDGPHVGKRLIESYRVLAKLPVANGPRFSSGFWPEWTREWTDELAQLEADTAQQEAEARAANRVRTLPTAAEISRMEATISWPAAYLARTRPILGRTVMVVALWRSRDRDLGWIAHKLRLGVHTVRVRNRTGLDLIAVGLRRDGVPVLPELRGSPRNA